MSEYFFGVKNGKMDEAEQARRRRAAKKHNADFIYAELPEGPRSWFACQNLGEPFDSETARAVMAELEGPQ